MEWGLENIEDQSHIDDDIDKDLHRNFTPGEGSFSKEINKPETFNLAKAESLKNKWQGDIGEGISIRVASERLNLTPDPRFDQPGQGFDGLFKDDEGNLVIVESKFTKNGIHSLHKDQMQPEWVARTADKMATPESSMYTEGNAEIATDIKETGTENVRRIVIATDPGTLEAKIFEGKSDGAWELLDQLDVLDFEQSYLE